MAGENSSSSSLILPSNYSAASTGSRSRAWGRPLSQSQHQSTENSTGGRSSTSLGALGLSSLGLDDSEKDGDHEGNLRQVEEEIQKRLHVCRKQKKSIFKRGKVTLNLSNVNLTTVQEATVVEMIQLGVEKVQLQRNQSLLVVPEALVKGVRGRTLTTLQTLDLSHCHITLLHRDWNLPNCTTLDLSHNRLKDFPSKNVLRGLPLLKSLDLYGNRIMTLPDFSSSSSSSSSHDTTKPTPSSADDGDVSTHSANSKPVKEARRPSSSSSMTSAIIRNKTNSSTSSKQQDRKSRKAELWNESGLLEHLTSLNVGYNDLTSLPNGLPPKVKTFIACNNFFSTVPYALVMDEGETLKELDVASNPISVPPPEVCESGLRTMRRWYKTHGNVLALSVPSGHQSSSAKGAPPPHQQRPSSRASSSNSSNSREARKAAKAAKAKNDQVIADYFGASSARSSAKSSNKD